MSGFLDVPTPSKRASHIKFSTLNYFAQFSWLNSERNRYKGDMLVYIFILLIQWILEEMGSQWVCLVCHLELENICILGGFDTYYEVTSYNVCIKLHFHSQYSGVLVLTSSKHRGLILLFNHCIQSLYKNPWNFKLSCPRRSHICVVLTAGNDLWGDRDNSPGLAFDSRWLAKFRRSPESPQYGKDTPSSISSVCFWYPKGKNYSGSLEKQNAPR